MTTSTNPTLVKFKDGKGEITQTFLGKSYDNRPFFCIRLHDGQELELDSKVARRAIHEIKLHVAELESREAAYVEQKRLELEREEQREARCVAFQANPTRFRRGDIVQVVYSQNERYVGQRATVTTENIRPDYPVRISFGAGNQGYHPWDLALVQAVSNPPAPHTYERGDRVKRRSDGVVGVVLSVYDEGYPGFSRISFQPIGEYRADVMESELELVESVSVRREREHAAQALAQSLPESRSFNLDLLRNASASATTRELAFVQDGVRFYYGDRVRIGVGHGPWSSAGDTGVLVSRAMSSSMVRVRIDRQFNRAYDRGHGDRTAAAYREGMTLLESDEAESDPVMPWD